MTNVKIEVVKAEDNLWNTFLVDEDKVDDQVRASIEFDGENFSAMGDNREEAIEELRDAINHHYNAKRHTAKLEINKAIGLHFFE